ncbi:MAG: hypothetical protein QOE09_3646 [Ilumatobacteraceae bacterium]|jgi:hypothetical protein
MARRCVLRALAVLAIVSACGTGTAANTAVSLPAPSTTRVLTEITVEQRKPRVLLIGDSTLLAVERYNGYRALRGFDYVLDAKSCRTLGIPSCGKRPLPPNAVEAIGKADGSFDDVVIMAGYDEWWTSFPMSFDEVVTAARAKGADRIIWLTYREGVTYRLGTGAADESFVKNNETLRAKVASGAYPDVMLAQWYPHTPDDIGWLSKDGVHLTRTGALGVADYISRWVAHVEGLPCPMPVTPGGAIEAVCSNPDPQPPIADPAALYAS